MLFRSAQVSFDQETGQPHVSFTLNPRGADLFDKLTADHIRERLAIVLDGIVHSAPVIQSRISGGRGQITLGSGNGDQMMNEAKDLAIVAPATANLLAKLAHGIADDALTTVLLAVRAPTLLAPAMNQLTCLGTKRSSSTRRNSSTRTSRLTISTTTATSC